MSARDWNSWAAAGGNRPQRPRSIQRISAKKGLNLHQNFEFPVPGNRANEHVDDTILGRMIEVALVISI